MNNGLNAIKVRFIMQFLRVLCFLLVGRLRIVRELCIMIILLMLVAFARWTARWFNGLLCVQYDIWGILLFLFNGFTCGIQRVLMSFYWVIQIVISNYSSLLNILIANLKKSAKIIGFSKQIGLKLDWKVYLQVLKIVLILYWKQTQNSNSTKLTTWN